jgi:hypothetical protein
LGRAKVAGLLVERTENKLTATITPADHAPDLAAIWAKVTVEAKPEPEVQPIAH